SGETVFASLGAEAEVFALAPASSTAPTESAAPTASSTPTDSAAPSTSPSSTPSTSEGTGDGSAGAPDAGETSAAEPATDDLAQTGVGSLWFLPLGLVLAGLGVAADLKARSTARGH